ncbi:RimK family protein [Chromatocurvus halotolerans]|uniref:Glutathione synthase/RimK-type ligase-like ATP-grasp enzyme n=1 Tax=Chromatocurvus halotolerans TaxID=1132028 RepID=A0A4R2KV18_9GAMM|nr:RimK family protein [Chromatocurvus halotolerans]TCO76677.1 glutathione synthase/RimK-type ligase-like ATP-grasp enzyme [Chromatocurvus halotolerans]
MRTTLVVVDDDALIDPDSSLDWISFEQYLSDYPKADEPRTRVINLCDTARYLSRGYYCSLLAEARRHSVLPSVSCINDLRERDDPSMGDVAPQAVRFNAEESLLRPLRSRDARETLLYFGTCEQAHWQKLGRQIFQRFPAPILRVTLPGEQLAGRIHVQRMGYAQLSAEQRREFLAALDLFTRGLWRNYGDSKRLRWDMAILVNPDEPSPPSDAGAIKRFIRAAAEVGIRAETLTPAQGDQILQYDALFLRETTAIDHHTYRLARTAEREGLIVIDDPQSILRCCNKIYLHDAFSYKGVPALPTLVVASSAEVDLDRIEHAFGYPVVLKLPEGSFSRGVFRIHSREELREQIDRLLAETTLVLAQAYCFTDYDWRIGVLAGKAIYACRYHMARNHWQIYNHASNSGSSGGFDTLPTFEVPQKVIRAAVKAAGVVGDGLYGVDIKEKDGSVFVIEVNDNPSIERGVEDKYLGNELYQLVMAEFARRLEQRGRR